MDSWHRPRCSKSWLRQSWIRKCARKFGSSVIPNWRQSLTRLCLSQRCTLCSVSERILMFRYLINCQLSYLYLRAKMKTPCPNPLWSNLLISCMPSPLIIQLLLEAAITFSTRTMWSKFLQVSILANLVSACQRKSLKLRARSAISHQEKQQCQETHPTQTLTFLVGKACLRQRLLRWCNPHLDHLFSLQKPPRSCSKEKSWD